MAHSRAQMTRGRNQVSERSSVAVATERFEISPAEEMRRSVRAPRYAGDIMTIAPPNPAQSPVSLLVEAEQSYGLEEKQRGAIFTRQSVVDFMLDLFGYTSDRPLHTLTLLEPSFGRGRFVLTAASRLVTAWRTAGGTDATELMNAIRAVELDESTFDGFQPVLIRSLTELGLSREDAEKLTATWLVHADYLFTDLGDEFDFVVGNPPYVRQELIPKNLLLMYRAGFPTMVGRADLYIAFMERSLDLLKPGGKLSFICADAWVKNEYGREIRRKIAADFTLAYYVDMYGLDAFEVQVGAYPSITVIERSTSNSTRVAHAPSIEAEDLRVLTTRLVTGDSSDASVLTMDAVRGSSPWLLSADPSLAVIHDLEARFPTVVEAGCRVGIGVATGADRAYLGPLDALDVEEDRKLPLATNKDMPGGQLTWTGMGVVNPWRDEGGLVDLDQYPKLAAHLERFREQLSGRHTAKGNVARNWYKTIDRITPSLKYEPKLLIPDIKGNGDAIAYDPGTLYPHHNLYFITSNVWDLHALQALLRSGIAHLFVAAYSVKIGGGYLRFQAQNLKRIRVPFWDSISAEDQADMALAGREGRKLSASLLERIYQLDVGTLGFLEES